jgi:hypothetical protein
MPAGLATVLVMILMTMKWMPGHMDADAAGTIVGIFGLCCVFWIMCDLNVTL